MENGLILYKTDNVFFGKIPGGDNCVVCKYEKDNSVTYRKIFEGSFRKGITLEDGSLVIYQSLKDFVDEQEIGSLLLDIKGVYKTAVSASNIRLIMRSATAKKELSPGEWDLICANAKRCANYISDLMGINIVTNPCSGLVDYKNGNINDVVIKATTANKFRKLLEEYIAIELLLEKEIIINKSKDGMDTRIKKAINGSKIKETEELKNNTFTIRVNRMNHEIFEHLLPDEKRTAVLSGKRICLK